MQFGAGEPISSIDSAHVLFLAHSSPMLLSQSRQRNNPSEWSTEPFFSSARRRGKPGPLQTSQHPHLERP